MGECVQRFDCLIRASLPFLEMDPNLELMSQLSELNGSGMEDPSMGLMCYSNDDYYLPHQPEFSVPFVDGLSGLPVECLKPIAKTLPASSVGEQSHGGDRKRKTILAPDTSSQNYSEAYSVTGLAEVETTNGSQGGKRRKSESKEADKPEEVVHVRARRGQATDSHSLAERVRRRKINERMRCLQDLVPGCYKTMGMAGMLDEIINYVQSLQNQVEFLSMKLSAASSFYDYSMGVETIATIQGDKAYEAERVEREGYGDCTSFHSSMPF